MISPRRFRPKTTPDLFQAVGLGPDAERCSQAAAVAATFAATSLPRGERHIRLGPGRGRITFVESLLRPADASQLVEQVRSAATDEGLRPVAQAVRDEAAGRAGRRGIAVVLEADPGKAGPLMTRLGTTF